MVRVSNSDLSLTTKPGGGRLRPVSAPGILALYALSDDSDDSKKLKIAVGRWEERLQGFLSELDVEELPTDDDKEKAQLIGMLQVIKPYMGFILRATATSKQERSFREAFENDLEKSSESELVSVTNKWLLDSADSLDQIVDELKEPFQRIAVSPVDVLKEIESTEEIDMSETELELTPRRLLRFVFAFAMATTHLERMKGSEDGRFNPEAAAKWAFIARDSIARAKSDMHSIKYQISRNVEAALANNTIPSIVRQLAYDHIDATPTITEIYTSSLDHPKNNQVMMLEVNPDELTTDEVVSVAYLVPYGYGSNKFLKLHIAEVNEEEIGEIRNGSRELPRGWGDFDSLERLDVVTQAHKISQTAPTS